MGWLADKMLSKVTPRPRGRPGAKAVRPSGRAVPKPLTEERARLIDDVRQQVRDLVPAERLAESAAFRRAQARIFAALEDEDGRKALVRTMRRMMDDQQPPERRGEER